MALTHPDIDKQYPINHNILYDQVAFIKNSTILLSHTESWFFILAVCMDWIIRVFQAVITSEDENTYV